MLIDSDRLARPRDDAADFHGFLSGEVDDVECPPLEKWGKYPNTSRPFAYKWHSVCSS